MSQAAAATCGWAEAAQAASSTPNSTSQHYLHVGQGVKEALRQLQLGWLHGWGRCRRSRGMARVSMYVEVDCRRGSSLSGALWSLMCKDGCGLWQGCWLRLCLALCAIHQLPAQVQEDLGQCSFVICSLSDEPCCSPYSCLHRCRRA